MSLDEKILKRIEKEQIRVIPRWFFALKDAFSWLHVGILFLVSSTAFAMLIFVLHQAGRPSFDVPVAYFWLAAFAAFFILGYNRFMQVGFLRVYKLSFMAIVPMLFFANVAFGYVFSQSEQVQNIETALEKIPEYKKYTPLEIVDVSKKDHAKFEKEKDESGRQDNGKNQEDGSAQGNQNFDETISKFQEPDDQSQGQANQLQQSDNRQQDQESQLQQLDGQQQDINSDPNVSQGNNDDVAEAGTMTKNQVKIIKNDVSKDFKSGSADVDNGNQGQVKGIETTKNDHGKDSGNDTNED